MKKLLSLIILSVFVFTLIGCGDGGTNQVQSSNPTGSSTTEFKQDPKNENRGTATAAEAGTE